MLSETQESLRERYGEPGDAARSKAVNCLDEHCVGFLELSPFAVLSTSGADGRCDASPRGGPPGFIRVLSPTRLALGELSGNRLFESVANVAVNPWVALLVLIPGCTETLRVEGRAVVTTDPEVCAATALDGRAPWAALVVDVDHAFVHCGKALVRSHLWDPASWPDADRRPRMGPMLAAHVSAPGPELGTSVSGSPAGSLHA